VRLHPAVLALAVATLLSSCAPQGRDEVAVHPTYTGFACDFGPVALSDHQGVPANIEASLSSCESSDAWVVTAAEVWDVFDSEEDARSELERLCAMERLSGSPVCMDFTS